MSADQEVVVVTGASAGVGRAVAREFGKRRARVGLIARGTDGLDAARKEIEAFGGQAIVLPTDVAEADKVDLAAAEVEKTFGPIDVWVNNAMTSVFSPVWDMEAEEIRRVTEVTYLGTVYGTMAALRRMLPRDRGTIVQVGLGAGVQEHPAPVRVLWRQARDGGLHGFATLRAHSPRQPRSSDRGAPAGDEHAAVRLGQEPAAEQGATRAAHL